MNFFSELSTRWSEKGPEFFKKVILLGNWLTATGVALIGVPATLTELIPKEVNFDLSLLGTIASYMVLAGVVISVVAKLPVNSTQNLKS